MSSRPYWKIATRIASGMSAIGTMVRGESGSTGSSANTTTTTSSASSTHSSCRRVRSSPRRNRRTRLVTAPMYTSGTSRNATVVSTASVPRSVSGAAKYPRTPTSVLKPEATPSAKITGASTAATATSQRHRGPGSRPSGKKINASGMKNVTAQLQLPLTTVASARQSGWSAQPAWATQASSGIPAPVDAYATPPPSRSQPTRLAGRYVAIGQPATASVTPRPVFVKTSSSLSRAADIPDNAPATIAVSNSAATTASSTAARAVDRPVLVMDTWWSPRPPDG